MKSADVMLIFHLNYTNQKHGEVDQRTLNKVVMVRLELDQTIEYSMESAMESCLITYNTLLDKGVAPEQARMVLPQSMMTEWYWSGTLYAFSRICNLRCKPDTQKETRDVADMINRLCDSKFPRSWKALTI